MRCSASSRALVRRSQVTQFRVVVKIGFLLDEGGSVG
jgi:hypothetical protein